MATPYQFNFPDMIRFVDDFKYVIQTGGLRKLFQKGGEFPNLFNLLMGLIKFLVAAVIIYLIYIIIFGGYPRFLVNIFTGSFYHKEMMSPFIKENGLVKNTINILLQNSKASIIFDKVYGTDLGSKLKDALLVLDTNINSFYNKVKGDDRYYEAIRDYYLYFDTVKIESDPKKENGYTITQPTETLTTTEGPTKISNPEFYIQQLGYFINNEGYDARGKGQDEQIIEIFNMDKAKGFAHFKNVAAIKVSFLKIADYIREMVNKIKEKPYLSYIIVPETDIDIKAFQADYGKYETNIKNGTVYDLSDVTKSSINKYTWYLIEYFKYKKDERNPYDTFTEIMNKAPIVWNIEEMRTIRKYINTSSSEVREKMKAGIFGRKLVKLQPKLIDPSRDVKEERYADNVRCNAAFFNFIEQHPIFCNIYFSDTIPNDKKAFYNKVMDTYDILYICDPNNSSDQFFKKYENNKTRPRQVVVNEITISILDNIKTNGHTFAKYVNSVNIFDLYMNEYKSTIIKTYKDQNYNESEFFKRLFNPYFEDFVNNRMKVYFMKTFSAAGWNASYNKFLVKWAKLGQLLKTLMGSIAGSFQQQTNVQEPQSVV